MIAEPAVVYPESAFEAVGVQAVREVLAEAGRKYLLVQRFGLDITIFIESSTGAAVRFIEAKSFGAQRAGGVGFGNGRGEGPQVELLCCSEGSMALLASAVPWILVDATLPLGSARYAWFDSETARGAAMGGVGKGKQNNFRVSALKACYRRWPDLVADVKAFLLEASGPPNDKMLTRPARAWNGGPCS